jgi:DUF4097 and DUF4098 domain-containing protein YvlB
VTRYIAIALICIAGGSALAAEKTLDRNFTVSAGGSLIVDTDGGAVHVSSDDSNQVVVHVFYKGSESELANANVNALQKGNDVSVTARMHERGWLWWGFGRGVEKIDVIVPRRYGISVRTGGGSVDLRDTIGTASLHTSGGDASAKNVTGNVELRTSGGSIQVDTIRGDVDAETSGGDVRLLNVDGKIRGNTSGGSVRCSLAGANRGISATTSGGDIELTLPRTTTANIDVSTSGGQIKSQIPVTSTQFEDKHLQGSTNGGGAVIYAHTSGGSISLRAEN